MKEIDQFSRQESTGKKRTGKKYKATAAVAAVGILLSGCSEEEQKGTVTVKVFEKERTYLVAQTPFCSVEGYDDADYVLWLTKQGGEVATSRRYYVDPQTYKKAKIGDTVDLSNSKVVSDNDPDTYGFK